MTPNLDALFAASCEHDPFLHPDDIWAVIKAGAGVFCTENSVLVVEAVDYPKKNNRIAQIVIAGGQQSDITGFLREQAEGWARKQGCNYAFLDGRRGWPRALQKHGYKPFTASALKEL